MQKVSENFLEASKFNFIENEVNKKILSSDIKDIVEVTYAYKKFNDNSNFNTTLFCKLLGKKDEDVFNEIEKLKIKGNFRYNKNIYLKREKVNISNKLNSKILDIDLKIEELNGLIGLSEDEVIKKELLLDSLKYSRNALEMALIGLPFELKKAGVSLLLNDDEIEEKVRKIENLEYQNFGGKISENPEEMRLIYNFMQANFDKNKENLTGEEQGEYLNYLNFLKEKVGNEYIKPKEDDIHPALMLEMKIDDYVEYTQSALKASGINKPVLKSKNHGSVSDTEDALFIADNEKYAIKSLNYINSVLVAHELTHMTTFKQGEKNFNGIRGAGYLEREEGLATYLEKLLKGDSNLVANGEPRLLIGEYFNGKETDKFIKLHNKLNPEIASGNILRNKRNYPMNYRGSQSKDLAYGRGLRLIKKIIEGNKETKKKFFIGKMNFDFIKRYGDNFIVSDDVLFHVVLAELMKYYSINYYDNKNFKLSHKNFLSYIDKKYEFLDMKEFEGLRERVFKSREIVKYVNFMKNKIKEVIDKNIK